MQRGTVSHHPVVLYLDSKGKPRFPEDDRRHNSRMFCQQILLTAQVNDSVATAELQRRMSRVKKQRREPELSCTRAVITATLEIMVGFLSF